MINAINAKKESAALNAPRLTAKPLSVTDSSITISQLLDFVNGYFHDVLPESVLRHYGYDARPDGKLGKDVLYQERTYTLSDREVLEMAVNEIKVSDLTQAENGALTILQNRLSNVKDLQESGQRLHGRG